MFNEKKEKKFRRAVRKEVDKIKVQGLKEFFEFSNAQPLKMRLSFCLKLIFKRL